MITIELRPSSCSECRFWITTPSLDIKLKGPGEVVSWCVLRLERIKPCESGIVRDTEVR